MSGITFTNHGGAAHYARFVGATLPGGHYLSVTAFKGSGRVALSVTGDMCDSTMTFTAAQARSVAGELLACADALQSETGRA